MGEPAAAPRATSAARPVRRGSSYAPAPEARDRLAFADGPTPGERSGPRRPREGGPGSRRLGLLAAAGAVVVVVVGALVAFAVAGGSPAPQERPLDRGPFDSSDDFILALHLPATFTRLAPEDASSFADADFVVEDGDFDAACVGLGRALRDMDPTFPELTPQEYTGGGVNRCEATGPMAALHGATVRALVLKANDAAQLYIDDSTRSPAPTSTAPPPSPLPSVPPPSAP